MAETSASNIWIMRAGFFLLALVIIFFHLIPLDTVPKNWAPPDLLIAFVFAWVLRRPDYIPALAVGAVMLIADLMFQRPPGLFALLVVLGCEYLKYRTYSPVEANFPGEWAAVAVTIAAVVILYRLILALLLVPVPPIGPSMIQMVLTIAVYPFVVILTQSLFGVRRRAPGDSHAAGGRV